MNFVLPRRNRILTASIASLVAICGTAEAQTWIGTTSTDWNTGSNWTGGAVPSGVNATINTTPTNVATISSNFTLFPVDIFVGNAALANGRLDHTAGTAGTGNGNWMFVGVSNATANGIYNLGIPGGGGTFSGLGLGSGSMNVGGSNTTAGRLYIGGRDTGTGGTGIVNMNTTGTLKIGNDLIIGSRSGTGTMNVDAGTITTNGWNFIGTDNGVAGSNGTLRMSGGSATTTLTNSNVGSRTYVGLGNATGSMVMSGGTYNNTGTGVDAQFAIGVSNLANATTPSVTMSGGTINANRLFTIGGNEAFGGNSASTGAGKGSFTMNGAGALLNVTGELWVGNAATSTGTMTVSAGLVQVNNWVAVGRNGSTGTLTLSGTGRIEKTGAGNFEVGGAGGTGTFHLDGGTLNTHNVTKNASGTGTFNFNGGQLQANAANATFMTGLTRANVRNNGAVIDTNGFNITIGQALLHSNIGGDNATDGGLTKNGSGTLSLSASNTFTGGVTVNTGTLATIAFNGPTGSLGTGPATVNAGATLRSDAADSFGFDAGSPSVFNLVGGTIATGGSGNFRTSLSNLNFTGGSLTSAGGNTGDASGIFSLNGNSITTNASPTAATISTTLGLASASTTFTVADGAAASDLTVSAPLVNTTYSGNTPSITKTGAGVMTLTASNTYTGATSVTGGILRVDNNGTSTLGRITGNASANAVSVSMGGTLLLAGSGTTDCLNDVAGITLAGGKFSVASTTREGTADTVIGGVFQGTGTNALGLGSLTLSATSTLDFDSLGASTLLNFTGFAPGAFTLNITNWSNTTFDSTLMNSGAMTDDRLVFSTSLTTGQLAAINFGVSGFTTTQVALGGGYYEIGIAPVPEPGTVFAAVGLLGLVVLCGRRRHRQAAPGWCFRPRLN